jgi:Alpha/beta hydrolase domain
VTNGPEPNPTLSQLAIDQQRARHEPGYDSQIPNKCSATKIKSGDYMLIRLFAALVMALSFSGVVQAAPQSSIDAVQIISSDPAGIFAGIPYRRVQGSIQGVVAASEPVAGLKDVAAGRDLVPYKTTFDITLPDDPSLANGVIVEASNRGGGASVLLGMMGASDASNHSPTSANASGVNHSEPVDNFLFDQHLSLAVIQWQAGETPGVPQAAQGIGEIIVRDFGRLLAGDFPQAHSSLPSFQYRILAGVSQSAWFVNSFIAEGFNVAPGSEVGIYHGVFTRNGNGNVLAINKFADGKSQFPYVQPDAAPLTPNELLTRPKSDPILVDVSSFTDFYRLRGSVFARAPGKPGLYRYATAAAHVAGNLLPPAFVFEKLKCNGGTVVPLNPISDSLYLRPLILGLANSIGVKMPLPQRLPPDAPFELIPAPPELQDINRLGTTALWTPRIGDNGAPAGGIPLIEVELPLGSAVPPALPPVGVNSIADICGNFSGWRPFTSEQLIQRYGSRAGYIKAAEKQAAHLVEKGYLLKQDQGEAVRQVVAQLPSGFQ